MQTTEQTTQTGFTLIELLIAVAIVALLAAIAVPAYTGYVEKARRSDATTGLTKIAAELERCYTQFSAYNKAGCNFGFVSNGALRNVAHADLGGGGIRSEEGDYDLTIAARAGSTAAQSYVLTATARAGGRQANDDVCDTFTLTNVGEKNSTPAPAAGADNPCW
jgi:type IV pilus assembly protein PilE